MPHVVGTSIGMVLLTAIAATGIAVLVTALPGAEVVLKIMTSAYLLYLAFRLAGGVAIDPVRAPEPFSVTRGAMFQFVNPKSWAFSIVVVGTFAPESALGVATLLAIIGTVVLATALVWAVGGSALSRTLTTERSRRTVGVVLALALVASIVVLWR